MDTPKKSTRLKRYSDHLRKTGRAPSTVLSYQNMVQAALNKMDPALRPFDAPALKDHTEQLASSSRQLFLSAWRSFQAFWIAQSPDGVTPLPDPIAKPVDLPEDVAFALFVLFQRAKIPMRTLSRLQWHHVQLEGHGKPRVVAIYARKASQYYICSGRARDALLTLRDWGQPADDSSPLVPVIPGSADHRPRSSIQKDIDRARRMSRDPIVRRQSSSSGTGAAATSPGGDGRPPLPPSPSPSSEPASLPDVDGVPIPGVEVG